MTSSQSSPPLDLSWGLSVDDDACHNDHCSHQDHQDHNHTDWEACRCCGTHGHMIIQDWGPVKSRAGEGPQEMQPSQSPLTMSWVPHPTYGQVPEHSSRGPSTLHQLFWLFSNGLEDVVVVSLSPTVPWWMPSQFPEAVVLWTAADSVTTGKEDTVGVVNGPRCLGQGYLALF